MAFDEKKMEEALGQYTEAKKEEILGTETDEQQHSQNLFAYDSRFLLFHRLAPPNSQIPGPIIT